MLVAEVQDSLLVVMYDLNRLDGLLAHAMENLILGPEGGEAVPFVESVPDCSNPVTQGKCKQVQLNSFE